MKKIVIRSFIMISALFSFEGLVHAQNYWDGTADKVFAGSGTESDPYLITSAQELAGLAVRTNVDKEDFSGKYLKLTQDIWLTDFTNPDTANWKEWEPIAHSLMQWNVATDYGYFRGHFDGDGHTVYNLYYGKGMNWADDWDPLDLDLDLNSYDFSVMNKALFVNLDGGTIENLNMANAKMAGVNQALLVLNVEANSVVRNCHVEGEIRGTQSSCNGLVYNNKGLIENCSATVNTNLQGGGAFVGTNEATGVIRNCTSVGFMRSTMSDGSGFVSVNNGLIEKCTANVHVQALGGPDAQKNAVGGHTFRYRSGAGFVLENSGVIRECAALGNLDAEGTSTNYVWSSAIAGFAYRNWNGRIESSYCTGALRDVSDSTGVGGDPIMTMFCYNNGENAIHLTDDAYRGDIYNCYTTSTISHHEANYYRNSIHPFVGTYRDFGGFNTENQGHVEPSQQIGCFFANEGLPSITDKSDATWNGIGRPLADMKTQAFVDELNNLASFLGTSQWELRDGMPRPTGVYQTDATVLFAGGDGTKASPYLISNKQELENLSWLVQCGMTFKGKYIRQTADIALNAPRSEWGTSAPKQWTPIGSPNSHPWYSNTIIMEFNGVYDGDFHEVQNMYINNLLRQQGLFGCVNSGAQLRNLGVTDAYIRAAGGIGILAGKIQGDPIVIQCWTSGDIATQGQEAWNLGAILGDQAGHSFILNCASSAILTGGNSRLSAYVDAVYGGYNTWAQDTLVNFLFTGCMNNGGDGSFGHFQYRENFFADKEKTKVATLADGNNTNITANSTEWTQSKELVNIYNYSVARWNECHAGNDTLQLHYWEWRENEYPRVSADANWKPSVKITFESNGGTHVTTKYIYAGVKLLPPQRPLRDGYIFAGWYKDAGLTQFFDWQNEVPTGNITLYARWHEDKRFDIDITPFQNEFATEYHIQTAAQLRGLAAMQNGMWEWGEKNSDCSGSSSILMYPTNPISQTLAPVSFEGKTIVLDNDILLCDTTDWQYWGRGAFGLPFKSIGSNYGVEGEGEIWFLGTFDGQGHVIYGMYQENEGMPNSSLGGGLFGVVGNGAVIKNVGIAASCLDYQVYNTRGAYDDATKYWMRCGFGTQGAPAHKGMLAGYVLDSVTIDQSYTEGNIFVQSAGGSLGGVIGQLGDPFYYKTGRVTNCYSRVNVYNTSIGGNIDYEPVDYGFAVLGKQVPIDQCYSAGHTYHSFANGNNYYGDSVKNCYYDKELVKVMVYTFRPGYIGTPKTANEMHAKATFVGWDFENIWGRNDAINDGYPYLRVFYESAPADSEDPVLVTGVTFNVTDTTLVAGDTLRLVATVLPENAVNKGVTWSVDESDWFSMDENGLITTHFLQNHMGQTATFTFTVTTNEGSYSATCKLKITQPKMESKVIAKRRYGETEWQAFSDGQMIENFEYMYLVYGIPNLSVGTINWSTDDENTFSLTPMSDTIYNIYGGHVEQYNYTCARVIVRAKQAGTSVVRATSAIGAVLEKTWSPVLVEPTILYIYQPPAQQGYYGLTYPDPDTQMDCGSTRQLDVIMYGNISGSHINSDSWSSGSSTDISYLPTIQWTSSNQAVLTVDKEGLVTSVSVGTATITATVVGTELSKTTAEITVSAVEAESIVINEWTGSTIELREGESIQLTTTITPANTTDKTVTWRSNNNEYVTIDQNGLVTAVKGSSSGNYITVYARTVNGREAHADFKILDVPAQEVILNSHEEELRVSETLQLTASVLPANASDKTVTWSSSSTTIASVDENGLITAKKPGTVNIIARVGTRRSDYRYDTCHVTVKPHELILSDHELTLYVGDSYQLEATTNPESTLKVTWNSTVSRVATVSKEDGLVTAVSVGNTQIIARIQSGSQYVYDTCQVTVISDEPVYYTVRYLNYDGSLLQKTQVPEGEIPVYNGQEPTRPDDEEYSYEFTGWMPEVVAATTNVDYIAQFRAIVKDGVSDIPASGNSAPRKVLIDGQIFIVRGEKLYNLIGQEVK